ncbi:hypothetical protein [Oceanobacillus timonensis]|uniref:hypothetical protein n=1 Tax=Oceanobacillus timonensis TaxID=1926285 RepID=UPI0015C4982D|nr:hypothetical protein [Oceanobacillus timonensis]
MILDLKGSSKMDPVVSMLYAALESNYHRLKFNFVNGLKKRELINGMEETDAFRIKKK